MRRKESDKSQITYTLDLSRFSEEKLKEMFKDGIIANHELINELNRRIDEKKEGDRIAKKVKKEIDNRRSGHGFVCVCDECM